jgi:hypothetical protein
MMGYPNILAILAIWGWPAFAVALFAFMPARRALVLGYLLAWLFLPQIALPLPFVKWDKHTATSVGAILGVLVFDSNKLFSFKPNLVDLPMAVWCFVPYSAAVSNGLSPYDGSAASATQFMVWGVPYLLGRVYLADLVGLRGLAVWVFVGGLMYVPFCLFECAISPQLHFMTYGFYQHDFTQVIRMGGYRPMVFMQHGLAVGMMMTAASLCGVWLWWTKSLRQVWNMPTWLPLSVLLITTLAVKSAGAIALLLLGLGVMFMTRVLRNYGVVMLLCTAPFVYMAARSVGGWDGQHVLTVIEQTMERDRALSLQCRFDNENLLLKKAMEKPAFGWGPNGRNLVTAPDGTILSIPDGLWVIAVGSNGIVGLIALFTAMLFPVLLVKRRFPGAAWGEPMLAGVAVFTVLLTLHAVDNLMNAMLNPLFVLALGGLAGTAVGAGGPAPRRHRAAGPGRGAGYPMAGRRPIPA